MMEEQLEMKIRENEQVHIGMFELKSECEQKVHNLTQANAVLTKRLETAAAKEHEAAKAAATAKAAASLASAAATINLCNTLSAALLPVLLNTPPAVGRSR